MKHNLNEKISLQKLAGIFKENKQLSEAREPVEIFKGEYAVLYKNDEDRHTLYIKIGDTIIDTVFFADNSGRIVSSTGCNCEDFDQPISNAMNKSIDFASTIKKIKRQR